MPDTPTKLTDQIKNLAQAIGTDIASLRSALSQSSSDLDDLVGTLVFDENTDTDEQTIATSINQAKANAISTSESYTDEQIGTLTVATGDDATVENAIAKAASDASTALSNKVGTLTVATGDDATVENAIAKAKSDLEASISSAVASAYIFKGTKATVAELPASGNTTGDVWNVTASSGNTPAGTNYAWNGSAWDALGGTLNATEVATLLLMSEDPLTVYNQAAGNT